jgi:hypothetical protein
MSDILNNQDLFASRFLAEATKKRLRTIPTESLRLVLKELHAIWAFNAYSTPRLWTPNSDDEPVVVIGNATNNGRLRKPRFGICTI